MKASTHENLEERLLHRMLFFTDAVFAIVLTLLVLELRPPEAVGVAAQMRALGEMTPKLLAFALSFAIVAIFWVAHMSTTRLLSHFDWPTAAVNLVFLFPICLVPFASAWLGEGLGTPIAWAVYAAVMIATSAGNVAMVWLSTRDGGRLLAGGLPPGERLYRVSRAASPGLAFVVGLILLALGQVHWAQFCWVLIPVFLWIRERLHRRYLRRVAAKA
ncbi:MAG TPA: TMEM175 family protein [Phenylobacterium sp.]|nr:TMEM175 family protein [Phenylobacterium sp.]